MPRCERCGATLSSATATCTRCGHAASESLPPWAHGGAARAPGEVTPPPWATGVTARPAAARAGAAPRPPSLPPPVPSRAGAAAPGGAVPPTPPAFAVTGAPPAPPRRPPPAPTVSPAAGTSASTPALPSEDSELPAGLRPRRRTSLGGVGCALAMAGVVAATMLSMAEKRQARRSAIPALLVQDTTHPRLPTAPGAPRPEPRGGTSARIEWAGRVLDATPSDLAGQPCVLTVNVSSRTGPGRPALRCGDVEIALPAGKLRLNEWVSALTPATEAAPSATGAGAPDGAAPARPSTAAPTLDAGSAAEAGAGLQAKLLYHLELFSPVDEEEVVFQSGVDGVLAVPLGTATIRLERFGHRRDDHPTSPIHGPATYDASPLARELVVEAAAPEARLPVGTRCRLEARLVRFVSGGGWCVAELGCGRRALYGKPGSVALGVNAADASWLPCTLDDSTGRPLFLRDLELAGADGDPLLVGPIDGDTLRFSERGNLAEADVTLRVVPPAAAETGAGAAPAAGGAGRGDTATGTSARAGATANDPMEGAPRLEPAASAAPLPAAPAPRLPAPTESPEPY